MLLSPLITGYMDAKREIEVLENKLSKAIPLLSEEDRVNSIFTALSEVIPVQVKSKEIDWQKMSSDVYRDLTKVADKYNVKILNYRPRLESLKKEKTQEDSTSENKGQRDKDKSALKSKTLRTLDIDVDLEGELSDFVRFVYYLEHSVQLMEVDEAILNAGSKKGLSIKLRIKKIIF